MPALIEYSIEGCHVASCVVNNQVESAQLATDM